MRQFPGTIGCFFGADAVSLGHRFNSSTVQRLNDLALPLLFNYFISHCNRLSSLHERAHAMFGQVNSGGLICVFTPLVVSSACEPTMGMASIVFTSIFGLACNLWGV